MTIWRMCAECWLLKATITYSEYVIFIAFPPQKWLHERASMLRYTNCTLPVLLEIIASCNDIYGMQYFTVIFIRNSLSLFPKDFYKWLWFHFWYADSARQMCVGCSLQWHTQEFCSGRVQQIQLRTEDRENGDLGGGSPLVRGSAGSCNLVQEISFHMVKFS